MERALAQATAVKTRGVDGIVFHYLGPAASPEVERIMNVFNFRRGKNGLSVNEYLNGFNYG